MQTFLPYPEFSRSAAVLDRQRLGKQRVEVLQLLTALTTGKGGWRNHPAARMWRGHEMSLCIYGVAICEEWTNRGYKDSCRIKIANISDTLSFGVGSPSWIGNPDFHAAHRSNLLRKDPDWYGQFGWTEPNNLPYIWPV